MPTKNPPLPPSRVPPLRFSRRSSSSCSSSESIASIERRSRSDTQKSGKALSVKSSEDVQETFIKVVCRVRPKLPKEKKATDGVEVHAGSQSLMLSNNRNDSKTFYVDHVFDSREADGCSQDIVFQQFGQDYVNLSLCGFNVCMFAYGHTGSGKTYTMLGDRGTDATGNLAGIIPRFLEELFDQHSMNERPSDKRQYTCEFFEVYNEHIKDLLVPAKSGDRTRKVHVHPKHGVRVENLTMSVVTNTEEALQLVEFGNQMRAVATTTMNARSSRSHAVFTFKYEQTGDGKCCRSTVTFVDLAGREDQAASQNQSQTFREMCCINTSLFHLANVITKLTQGTLDRRSLSDFRNSKLTLLLSPALIGNCKTALIATIAPLKSFVDDSVSTLNFAATVKKIKTRPVINNKNPNACVAELEKEIRQLQSDLSVSKVGEAEKERALLCAEALIRNYKRSWEEAVSKTQEYQYRRKQSLSTMGLPDLAQLGQTPTNDSNYHIPFMTKLSNDPSLQGRCNYMLNKSTLSIGSDEKNCTLVLHGLGILPQMCELRCRSGVVEIGLCSKEVEPAPRVLVDGYPLLPSHGARTLIHGSCVFLGYSHAFRLVVPKPEHLLAAGSADPCVIARATLEKLDMHSAVCEIVDESGEQFKDILPYVNNLSSRAADSTVQDFISAIHRICPMIDEANMITREIFGNDGMFFQLHALTNVFNFDNDYPEFVVCLLQNAHGTAKFKRGVQTVMHNLHKNRVHVDDSVTEGTPAESDTSLLLGKAHHPLVYAMGLSDHMCIDKSPLVYVWSLEKFLWRLNAIRDYYHDGCEGKDKFQSVRKSLADNPFMSPWREVALSEGVLLSAAHGLAGHGSPRKCQSPDTVSELSVSSPITTSEFEASDLAVFPDLISPAAKDSVGVANRSKGWPSNQPKHRRSKGKYESNSGDDSSSIGSNPQSQGCSSTMYAAFEGSGSASVNPSDNAIDSVLQQQTEWNRALGEKVETLSNDIAHLRGALLSPRQQSPSPDVGHKGSEEVTNWLSQVDGLRDTLETLRNCTEEVERLATKKREEGSPATESMAEKVFQQVRHLRSDVANIVKEELKDHLSTLKTGLSTDGSTFCSSQIGSGRCSPEAGGSLQSNAPKVPQNASRAENSGKFEAVVYRPRLSSASSSPPNGASLEAKGPSSASYGSPPGKAHNTSNPSLLRKPSRQHAYPSASFTPMSSKVVTPKTTSPPLSSPQRALPQRAPLSSRSMTPRSSSHAALLPSRFPSYVPSMAPVGRVARSDSGCSLSTAASTTATGTRKPSHSPKRRLVGPYPKVTWCYYELPEESSVVGLGCQ